MFYLALVSALLVFVAAPLLTAFNNIWDAETALDFLKKGLKPLPVILAIPLALLIAYGSTSLARTWGQNDVVGGYRQFYNGVLVSADKSHQFCERDGGCRENYDCDRHKVVDSAAYFDKDGNYHQEQWHYEWHSCPKATEEYYYTVTSSLGDNYLIGGVRYGLHPKRWTENGYVPDGASEDFPGQVGLGAPSEWKGYKYDIAAGYPSGVTKVTTYTNYVLASQNTILKQYSSRVDYYLGKKWLPEHTKDFLKGEPVHDGFEADKLNLVGVKLDEAQQNKWQHALMRFNGALGMQLQGDLHMVLISDQLVASGQSEDYTNALIAYWQGPKMGKKALAKNGVVVVLGVSPKDTISWARAKTGMPIGNGEMLRAIESELNGKLLKPSLILGRVKVVSQMVNGKSELKFTHGQGLLETIMFESHPFARACMDCKSKDDHGTGFVYLKSDVKIPRWAYAAAIFMSIVCSALAAAALQFFWPLDGQNLDSKRYRY